MLLRSTRLPVSMSSSIKTKGHFSFLLYYGKVKTRQQNLTHYSKFHFNLDTYTSKSSSISVQNEMKLTVNLVFTTFLFSGQFHQTHWSAAINHSNDRNSSCLTLSFIYCHPQQLKPPLVTNSQLELDSSDLSLVFA